MQKKMQLRKMQIRNLLCGRTVGIMLLCKINDVYLFILYMLYKLSYRGFCPIVPIAVILYEVFIIIIYDEY